MVFTSNVVLPKWGYNGDKTKMHLVNWNTVCQPKSFGGLGKQSPVGKLYKMSRVFSLKFLMERLQWRVGNGDNILFWKDNWADCGPLETFATISLSNDLLEWIVSYFLTEQGKLLTNVQRVRRNLASDPNCPCCNISMESLDHLFRRLRLLNKFSMNTKASKQILKLHWSPPCVGCFKINVDGSCMGEMGTISARGIIRDFTDGWINGLQIWGVVKSLKLNYEVFSGVYSLHGTKVSGELKWSVTLLLLSI
ncbi:hypothetical protein ACE6H2_017905 [Prunus campanulata]